MNWRMTSVVIALLVLISGCTPKLPEIVQVNGSLQLRGKPLAKATVKFLPMVDGLGGNFTASAVTDDKGKFSLSLPGKKGPGCYACEMKVLISEGPTPPGSRDETAEGRAIADAYRKSLKNRPIPKKYGRVGTTPLDVVVSPEENEFDFVL